MIKSIYDRIGYAIIVFIFGAILGLILFCLYDAGLSLRVSSKRYDMGLLNWIKYCGGIFAILGFFLKSRVGDIFGGSSKVISDYETYKDLRTDIPSWVVAAVLIGVVLFVWKVF